MKHLFLAIALFFGVQLVAQKKDKKEKEDAKTFYKDATVETDDYNIYVIDVVAVDGYAKFKIKIFNKTNDYLLVKPSEFVYTAGDKKAYSKDKTYSVPPNEEESEVIDFKGQDMQATSFTIDFKGIYKASAAGKPISIPDFELPATKNEFTAENCTCVLKKADLSTDKTVTKFYCSYNGDGVTIINPVKASLIMPNGQENANTKRHKPIILEKGNTDDFFMVYLEVKGAGDMQKKKTQIKWNDTFRESKLLLTPATKLTFEKESSKK